MTSETGVQTPTWWSRAHGGEDGFLVAYFCLEFGVDESLPIYSGGLGVLAGDHLKSASDLGIPLVGVGLLYRDGYFRQQVDESGRQREAPQPVDPERLGLVREPVSVEVDGIEAAVWRKDVGRVPLYLLDAPGLTDGLYAGDREHRLRQELLAGVGGVRALAALGLEPTVFHMNEGHCAFLALERLRREPFEQVRETTVFTTHTPVPAGNEVFDRELVRGYVDDEDFLALGEWEGEFGMTPLALRLSAHANAVSELHGEVAREMWQGIDTSIGHVTNGVHPGTWLAPEIAAGGDVWETHRALKRRLTDQAGLDPDLLTIGLARRFATYKRAGLVFSDLERLLALPVQVIVAGKSHPADEAGKDLMQTIVELSKGTDRVVFLEGYDMGVARLLVQGCDVWLNTPRRPLEASGTSGMKAGMNGVLNLSVLDGWWAEGYSPELGWAIPGADDEADAAELYRLLEEEVVPAYADRERWTAMMRASIEQVGERFSMHRAVIEYVERYYLAAHRA